VDAGRPFYTSYYYDDDDNNDNSVLADDSDARYQPLFRLERFVTYSTYSLTHQKYHSSEFYFSF